MTADDQSKTYGAANPTLTHTTTGFVNGDGEGDLGGTVDLLDDRPTRPARSGDYPITCAVRTSTNYAITYVDGTLTIDAGGVDGDRGRPDQDVRGGEPDVDAHDDRVRER